MKTVTLKADGSIWVNNQPLEQSPLLLLGERITLSKGYRLRSYFEMLKAYPVFQELSEFLPDVMGRYRNSTGAGDAYLAASQLEFGKTIEMIGFPGKSRLELYSSLRDATEQGYFEIRSYNLSGLLDVPLRLGKLRHIVFGDQVDVLEFETAYTLFEFIDGISWELGFHTTSGECNIRR